MTKSRFWRATIVALLVPLVGCAAGPGPRRISEVRPDAPRLLEDWSRVRQLPADAELVVTVRGSQPAMRRFVLADEFSLLVLNLTDATLPPVSARALRNMAARYPERFATMQASGTFVDGDVRVGKDGVFVRDRKIADLGQVVQAIDRKDVTEIRGPVVARGSVPGGLLGGWLGFAVGAVPALGGATNIVAAASLLGSVVGGAFLGSHWSSHQTEGIVYRIP